MSACSLASGPCRSLPLMGIGNSPISTRRFSTGCTHCPSWGSETGSRSSRNCIQRGLITPHGDRKPHDLLGSVRFADPLITPHGDRKPGIAYAKERAATFSLPLMGIGNPSGPRRVGGHLVLITPHGDRKRGGRARPAGAHRSHYPSWGSETPGGCIRRRWLSASLPLMGIGNNDWVAAATMPVAAHYPSWGSETSASSGEGLASPKPHYPSWGSETWLAGTAKLQQSSSSLPLMGIGNIPHRQPQLPG